MGTCRKCGKFGNVSTKLKRACYLLGLILQPKMLPSAGGAGVGNERSAGDMFVYVQLKVNPSVNSLGDFL